MVRLLRVIFRSDGGGRVDEVELAEVVDQRVKLAGHPFGHLSVADQSRGSVQAIRL